MVTQRDSPSRFVIESFAGGPIVFVRIRRSAVILVSAAVLSGAGAVPSLGTTAGTRPVAFPRHPHGLSSPHRLPNTVDPAIDYMGQVSCSPRLMPGVRKLRRLVLRTYHRGSDGGVTRSCVVGGQSEHKEGRAWDFMLSASNKRNRKVAGNFLGWLTKHHGLKARRLGVMYVIYNRRMWRAYDPARGWAPYTGSDPHTSHIHLSFTWAGGRGRTSFWTGRVARPDYGPCSAFRGQIARIAKGRNPNPCPVPAKAVKHSTRPATLYGASGHKVRVAQRQLGASVTGTFGSSTWKAVKRYQRAHDLAVTGAVDKSTWSSLLPSSVSRSVTAGYHPHGAARYGLRHFSRERLTRASAGAPVAFLQIALKMAKSKRNGLLGRNTAEQLRAFKAKHGLHRNAVVTPEVWQALARR